MSDTELVTCIYDSWEHECDHWLDDAEFHSRRGEQPCIPEPEPSVSAE